MSKCSKSNEESSNRLSRGTEPCNQSSAPPGAPSSDEESDDDHRTDRSQSPQSSTVIPVVVEFGDRLSSAFVVVEPDGLALRAELSNADNVRPALGMRQPVPESEGRRHVS